ncbi:long-chain fatty acid--CoA ligase [Bacillus sp. HMF5848]|nr:long-chain fatty acid--CoA ligase [Bacillus sp. HMF5848]
MNHFTHWPKRVSKTLSIPETSIYHNLQIACERYPHKIAVHYYGNHITYYELNECVSNVAGYLQRKLNVKRGDPVLLYMQNSPQFIISYYAILKIGAIVIPINPMNTGEELSFYIKDCGIRHGLVGQELLNRLDGLFDSTSLEKVIVAAYSDYAGHEEEAPPEVKAGRQTITSSYIDSWEAVIQANYESIPIPTRKDDITVMPYTSGTTGLPKGCVHTNSTVQANIVSAYHWMNATSDSVHLLTLPLFHVTGMVHSMHVPLYAGAAMVIMTRWDRKYAAKLIEQYKCTHWVNISTMLIDFLANPELAHYDITSLSSIAGGGAPLPEAVGEKLFNLTGLKFVEGYGLSETISHTHFNPPDRPKLQCLGIPSFDVDARIIDPVTQAELAVGEIGEIVVNGPQVFMGYYNRDDENRSSFIELDGKTFFRTGDIGRMDEEGYFFIVDRVKRMINAAGFKVWPTEIESMLYKHPAVQQACVVGVPDPRRGESVKAFIILNADYTGKVSESEIIDWAKEKMAAYKYPRSIEFRTSFPTTSSGKILWRKLQEEEWQKQGGIKQ